MTLRKIVIALLALLLAGAVIVPCVSAEENLTKQTAIEVENWLNGPTHYIPPEYFKDAKPATPLPESEMINLIISEKNVNKSDKDRSVGLVILPISSLNINEDFKKSTEYPNQFIENSITSDDAVILVRMPKEMYDRFLLTSKNNNLILPESNFCRYYKNLAELNSHLILDGDILTVKPGEEDAAMLEKITSIPIAMDPAVIPSVIRSESDVGLKHAQAPNNSHNEATFFNRINTNTNYDYYIGRITPNTWSVSGNNDKYYAPQEREYHLNGYKDVIEIVVNYDHYTQYPAGKVKLFPCIYDNSDTAVDIKNYENPGEGIIELDPGTFPHSYGYHVQISNARYYITFQDMNDLHWYHQYVYYDPDNPSTTVDYGNGSSEFVQITSPITDSFYAATTPVIDEWVRELNGNWNKPSAVWTFGSQTPDQNFVHINRYWGGSNMEELITESYVWSGWA
ncbi:MAG: hypothetical protein WC379_12950 [Methanoregula sp.]|jgi:hypothetical protein